MARAKAAVRISAELRRYIAKKHGEGKCLRVLIGRRYFLPGDTRLVLDWEDGGRRCRCGKVVERESSDG